MAKPMPLLPPMTKASFMILEIVLNWSAKIGKKRVGMLNLTIFALEKNRYG
jgi:hypothetical protein